MLSKFNDPVIIHAVKNLSSLTNINFGKFMEWIKGLKDHEIECMTKERDGDELRQQQGRIQVLSHILKEIENVNLRSQERSAEEVKGK